MDAHQLEYQVTVHSEDGSFWGEVAELPGLFVAGDTVDEVFASLPEAIELYLTEPGQSQLTIKVRAIEQFHTQVLVDC